MDNYFIKQGFIMSAKKEGVSYENIIRLAKLAFFEDIQPMFSNIDMPGEIIPPHPVTMPASSAMPAQVNAPDIGTYEVNMPNIGTYTLNRPNLTNPSLTNPSLASPSLTAPGAIDIPRFTPPNLPDIQHIPVPKIQLTGGLFT